jgi:hypothetical protein
VNFHLGWLFVGAFGGTMIAQTGTAQGGTNHVHSHQQAPPTQCRADRVVRRPVCVARGRAYAAFKLPNNSVGTNQIKNGAVTTIKIKNGVVTKSQINTSGLTVPNALFANTAGSAGSATNASHASSADNATNAANATNAGHASSADGLTTLPSGQSESGVFATADGVGPSSFGYMGLTITYPRPLAAAISAANIIDVHGTSGTHCPGIGQADPGYLCLYDTDTSGTTGTVFYSNTGPDTGVGKLGVVLYWTVTTGDSYVGGSWTVTAP